MTTPPIAINDKRTATEVCKAIELSDNARKLLEPKLAPLAFLVLLEKQELFADAFALLAHWLPKRTAVWWGCLCVWHLARPQVLDLAEAALQAAVRWVQDPSETNRRAAQAAGEKAGITTPAGCLALAAFYSHGNISQPDLPEVHPPPHLCAVTVAAGLQLAAAQAPPEQCLRFLAFGRELAQGKNHWQ